MGGTETRGHVSTSNRPFYLLDTVQSILLRLALLASSDADSDVLADYVLALIRAETPEPELRLNAIENLEDFLKECARYLFRLKYFYYVPYAHRDSLLPQIPQLS